MDYLWSRIQKLEQIEITVTFFDYYCFWCEFLMKVYPRIPRILVNAFLIWSKQNYSLLPTLSLSVLDTINPKLILIQIIKCQPQYLVTTTVLESEIRRFILDEMKWLYVSWFAIILEYKTHMLGTYFVFILKILHKHYNKTTITQFTIYILLKIPKNGTF